MAGKTIKTAFGLAKMRRKLAGDQKWRIGGQSRIWLGLA